MNDENDRAAYERVTAAIDDEEGETTDLPNLPSERHQLIFDAVRANPNHALQTYHQMLAADDETPYDDASTFNDERHDIRDKMWELKDLGYVINDYKKWRPTEDASG